VIPRSIGRAAIAAALALGAGEARAAEGELRVALLPMVVHSAEEPRYLREGMADMLESRLSRAGRIKVVRVEDPNVATTRLSRAVSTGRQYGADYVLFGSFTRFGAGASLDLTCAPTRQGVTEEDQLRELFVQSGSVEQVIPALDDLVGKVARFVESDSSGQPEVAANGGDPARPAPAAEAGAGKAADGSGAAAAAELEALRRRVEALEAAVYGEEAGERGAQR
jgi:TolB-like protein